MSSPASSSRDGRPAKRRKTALRAFGASTEDDLPTPQAQANAPSAVAWSTRVLAPDNIPSLVALCIRVFADNLQNLGKDTYIWEHVRYNLKLIPDHLVPRVFAALRTICPTILGHAFIQAFLLRGGEITLGSDLPGVRNATIAAIGESVSIQTLQKLELSGFEKYQDSLFASVVSKATSLQVLILRGCTKVGPKTIAAAVKHCPQLKAANLKYTAVPPAALAPLLLNCKKLEVLKVAGIPNWTDATFAKLLSALGPADQLHLPNLRSLNVRQTHLSDASLTPFLAACPGIQRIDLSFTLVRHLALLLSNLTLEKLSLTSTKISGDELVTVISKSQQLKTLNIGALGGGQGSSVAISNSSAMTMTDEGLRSLTSALEQCVGLEHVNLVGNTKLGMTGRHAMADFIRRVGRRCKSLNMASISSLRSSDLEGLLSETAEGESNLRILVLNQTSVDDQIAPYVSSCPLLERLELAGTRVTTAGLFPIIDACDKLQTLNLTSCRGVAVADRRKFFEVWREEWQHR